MSGGISTVKRLKAMLDILETTLDIAQGDIENITHIPHAAISSVTKVEKHIATMVDSLAMAGLELKSIQTYIDARMELSIIIRLEKISIIRDIAIGMLCDKYLYNHWGFHALVELHASGKLEYFIRTAGNLVLNELEFNNWVMERNKQGNLLEAAEALRKVSINWPIT